MSALTNNPTLFAIGFARLCVVSIVLGMTRQQFYKEDLNLGPVKNADNARLNLGTLVDGIISLMVFRFPMRGQRRGRASHSAPRPGDPRPGVRLAGRRAGSPCRRRGGAVVEPGRASSRAIA